MRKVFFALIYATRLQLLQTGGGNDRQVSLKIVFYDDIFAM
jgi:hypothetical protein